LTPADFESWEPVAQASGWTLEGTGGFSVDGTPVAAWAHPEPARLTLIASKEIPGFRALAIGDHAYGAVRKGMLSGGAITEPVHRFSTPHDCAGLQPSPINSTSQEAGQ